MRITRLSLQTNKLAIVKRFYTEVLNLPLIEQQEESLTFQVGESQLVFQSTAQSDVVYHIAFTVPGNKIQQAKSWLQERVPLLTQDGQDEFSFQSWNSLSLYFLDAVGNILELIAHFSLPNQRDGDFSSDDLLYISEIGLPVDDVPAAIADLRTRFKLEPYTEQSETFTALGDAQGLFIVVKEGRPWFPTSIKSVVSPVTVTIEGEGNQLYHMNGQPYIIKVGESI